MHSPIPFLSNALMRRDARKALDQIGINIPSIDVPAARLSGGQRQAIAVARTISGDADIILLDEPLAAMGAKEGAMILDLIARLKDEGNVSIIMILHNYVHVLAACDRVNLIQDGVIGLDKPTAETSVEELTEIVVEEYRRARLEAQAQAAAPIGNGRRLRPRRRRGAARSLRVAGERAGLLHRCRLRHRVRPRPAARRRAPARSWRSAWSATRARSSTPSCRGPASALGHDWALQDPDDWVKVLDEGVPDVLEQARRAAEQVVGLGVDFTSCTVLPVSADGEPLCRAERWREPAARVAQAVEAPRRPAGRRPAQRGRARARASRSWSATAGGSPRSGTSPS